MTSQCAGVHPNINETTRGLPIAEEQAPEVRRRAKPVVLSPTVAALEEYEHERQERLRREATTAAGAAPVQRAPPASTHVVDTPGIGNRHLSWGSAADSSDNAGDAFARASLTARKQFCNIHKSMTNVRVISHLFQAGINFPGI